MSTDPKPFPPTVVLVGLAVLTATAAYRQIRARKPAVPRIADQREAPAVPDRRPAAGRKRKPRST